MDTLTVVRFLRYVEIPQKADACWEWRGTRVQGYGAVSINGHPERAHRASYEHFVGPIPAGLYVCHACDNRACVRPDHLFLGTALDNIRDASAKGRMGTGERNGWRTKPTILAKRTHRPRMSDDVVREVRRLLAEGISGSAIARQFGVSPSAISHVRTGSRHHGKAA